MAEITASMVKELREKTDAPMMECKKALTEAAATWPRPRRSCASSWATRPARPQPAWRPRAWWQSTSFADGKLGSIFEINCETDFVAKNEDFLKLAADCGAGGGKEPGRRRRAGGPAFGRRHGRIHPYRAGGQDRREHEIRRFVRVAAKGKLTSYIHGGSKIGVLVDVVGGDEQLAKDLAMHIAASKPKSLDSSGVSADLLDMERRIAVEKAREAGKPEAMLEKSPKARCRST
jgi:elongation factor Ts